MRWTNRIATNLPWPAEIAHRGNKEQVAAQIVSKVNDGDVIGVGSGSTAFLALQVIARDAAARKLRLTAIPTSAEVALACAALGIPTTSLLETRPDWCFDGADEVDPRNNLIKGRGGAMFREKLVALASPRIYILIDPSKLVQSLGERFPIPVETYPDCLHYVEGALASLGAVQVQLRLATAKDGPVITESGNFILDARFEKIRPELEKEIKSLCGVIESGLFIGYNVELLVAR